MIRDMNGKRVLVFHPTIAPYRIRFFNELNKKWNTKVCLYYRNLKSQKFNYDDIEQKFEFHPDYLDKSIRIKTRTFFLGHRKEILDYNPNIVIVSEYGEGLWAAILTRLIYRKCYKIVTICDDSLKIAEECRGLRKISRNVGVRLIDGIILCNDKVKEWYRKNFSVRTFSFPIIQDEKDFRENEEQIMELAHNYLKDYGLIGKKVFLFVGRFAPEKNIEYLLRSFIKSHERYPDNILVLIGGASEKDPTLPDRALKLIQANDSKAYILYVGRKEGEELKAWYFIGQVFVLPSIYEPFGAVVNEALLAGEYVMVSENAGSACMVNSENGSILDITQPYIDFSNMTQRIEPIDCAWKPQESRMPFLFQDKMQKLLEWIEFL